MSIIDKIKLFFTVSKELNKIREAKMKSGWKTTEFWLTVLGALLSVLAMAGSLIPPTLTAQIVGGLIMVYTIARAIVKFTPSTKDDEVLAKFEALLKEKNILN